MVKQQMVVVFSAFSIHFTHHKNIHENACQSSPNISRLHPIILTYLDTSSGYSVGMWVDDDQHHLATLIVGDARGGFVYQKQQNVCVLCRISPAVKVNVPFTTVGLILFFFRVASLDSFPRDFITEFLVHSAAKKSG